MNAIVDIYEFSTGIEIKRTARGWESGGFTGDYMNRTIDPIPKAAIDAITNREFALAEGATLTNPAIVGREVTGYGETWSMLAVVTRGLDDRGRGVSLYRYFLCRGGGHLEAILRWMGSSVRVFDPFEDRVMGRSHRVEFSPRPVPLKPEFEALLLMMPPIIISATEVCTPLVLDRITQEIAGSDARSWAYQVAALERPEYFQVIYPASASAEAVFRQVLTSRPAAALVAGEGAIVSALKALVNDRVKPGNLEVLENACGNPQITEAFWAKLFDKQGAGKAIAEAIYGSRNVRLLTLKAILIPRFLPTLLAWLKNSGRSDEQYSASLVLQSKILDSCTDFSRACPGLTVMLKQGIGGLLNYLIDKPQVLAEAQFLLTEPGGLWFYVWRSLSVELEHDLAVMGGYVSGSQTSGFQTTGCKDMAIFLDKLKPFWISSTRQDARFLVLAELFDVTPMSQLTAIFYQFAEGSVPKSVFFRVAGEGQYAKLFGLYVRRRMTAVDYVRLFLLEPIDFGGIEMPKAIVGLILLIAFTSGLLGSWGLNEVLTNNSSKDNLNAKTQSSPSPTPTPTTQPTPTSPDPTAPSISQKQLEQAESSLEETKKTIGKIKTYLESELTSDELSEINKKWRGDRSKYPKNPGYNEGFYIALESILELKDFSYSDFDNDGDEIRKFLNAVYEYQFKNNLVPDGIISQKGETQEKFKSAIKQYLLDDKEEKQKRGA
ncbi:MAG: hypothetical protein HC795_06110 [Coleofasciculaceae cyanobacterium RL_1_1]|nr:hypothetical protein [Coleofasciculaceae cyanobacterium RL_1_1]